MILSQSRLGKKEKERVHLLRWRANQRVVVIVVGAAGHVITGKRIISQQIEFPETISFL